MAEVDDIINKPSPAEERITELSGKVKEQADARLAAETATATAEAKTLEAERERDFYASFTDTVSKNPSAQEFKDDILAKVKGGLSVEDATFAVLGKAGKLGSPAEPEEPAGGSAPITPPSSGTKSATEMTQEERKAALIEAQSRGDLSLG